ncbi:hypothetical protein WBK31_11490 [Nonomuraea sp. N2-4H]
MPRPKRINGPAMPVAYPDIAESRVSQRMPAAIATVPDAVTALGPSRDSSHGTARAETSAVKASGRNAIPVASGVKPSTVCRNWVRKKNIPSMVAEIRNMSRYAAARLRSRNSPSGSSGCATRASATRKRTSATSATASAASALRSPHPASPARTKP